MRIRLIASFMLVVLVTIGVVVVVMQQQTAQAVRNFMFRGGLSGIEEIVADLEAHYAAYQTWDGASSILKQPTQGNHRGPWSQQNKNNQSETANPQPLSLRLVDSAGNLVVDTLPDRSETEITRLDLRQGVALEANGEVVGYLLSDTNQFFTADNENTLLSRLNRAALYAVLIAGVIAVALAFVLSYRLLRPVKTLTQAASALGRGDLAQRVAIRGNDEVATLGTTFNTMAASLQQSEQSRRALTADIAHELRTPLAVQRAHLEAIQDGIYPLTLENLKPIEAQNRLLTRLVDDLRTLALADSGQLTLEKTTTDVIALLNGVANRFAPQASERQIVIQCQFDPQAVIVQSDPQRIEQILHNLIDNALRYTPDSGLIWIEMQKRSQTVQIQVTDSGPGIPAEALPYIFDRFYRADKSRTRAQGGTGLGLSIARKIAQAHGGDLTVANRPQAGAEFTLTLPLN